MCPATSARAQSCLWSDLTSDCCRVAARGVSAWAPWCHRTAPAGVCRGIITCARGDVTVSTGVTDTFTLSAELVSRCMALKQVEELELLHFIFGVGCVPLNFFAVGRTVASAKETSISTTGAGKCCAEVIVLWQRPFFLV